MQEQPQQNKQEDVVSILTDAFFSAAKGTVKFMTSPILHSVGLEKLPETNQTTGMPTIVNDRSNSGANVSKDVNSMAKPVAPEVKKLLDLGNVFIKSNQAGIEGDVRIVSETAKLQVKAVLDQINTSLSDPEVRESLKKFIAVGESVVIELEPLVAEVVTQFMKIGMKTGGDIAKAMVIMFIDAAAAIPGLGTFINLAKVAGSGALMLYQIVDNSRTSFVISGELLGRIRDMLQGQVVQQKAGSRQIGGRTMTRLESRINASIQQFSNPTNRTIKKRRRQNTRRRGRR
jgi:hypothetical protein